MTDYRPPRMLSVPFRLTGMTLRGVGSYLHGQRLNIRPLTILCGKNGSGKSTWIESLHKLQACAISENFPIRDMLDPVTSGDYYSRWINASLTDLPKDMFSGDLDAIKSYRDRLANPRDEDEYGPWGSIGLEFCVEENWDIEFPESTADSSLDFAADSSGVRLLLDGTLNAGAKLRIRWAVPRLPSAGFHNGLKDLFEITINDVETIRVHRLLSGHAWPIECPLVIEIPASWLSTQVENASQLVVIASESESLRFKSCYPLLNDQEVNEFWQRFRKVYTELVRKLLGECFHIGAFRTPPEGPTRGVITEEKNKESLRDVSKDGSRAEAVRQRWIGSLVRQAAPPYTGHIDNSLRPSDLVSHETSAIRDDHYFFAMVDRKLKLKEQLDKLSPPPENKTGLNDEMIVRMNRLLPRRNFTCEPLSPSTLEEFGNPPEDSADWTLSLTEDEIVRLNRLRVEDVLNGGDGNTWTLRHRPAYLVGTIVDYWMSRLCEVETTYGSIWSYSLRDDWLDHSQPPNGGPVNDSPMEIRRNDRGERQTAEEHRQFYDGIDGAAHDEFITKSDSLVEPSPSNLMSTGYHQVLPIVVQASVMKQREIFCIENPEAHLHPAAQLAMAEFLMSQASGNKTLIVETHSDLIVRRIMRAVREEDTKLLPGGQSSVSVAFARKSVMEGNARIRVSELEPVSIDAGSNIENWPEGFLSDGHDEAVKMINAAVQRADLRHIEEGDNEQGDQK